MLPSTSTLLMAESFQGKLISCNVTTGNVETWLEHMLLGKVTDRPSWPGLNGLQHVRIRLSCCVPLSIRLLASSGELSVSDSA
jgi:hypothetical protein